ncbi:MAG: hypothetical protein ACYDBB_00870 [Armatimonadota bacterium]
MSVRLKRRRWVWVIIGLAVLVGIWWWRQPRTLRVVGMATGHRPFATAAGVLVWEYPATFIYGQDLAVTLHDWAKGEARWHVRVPTQRQMSAQPSGWTDATTRFSLTDVSPDGQTFANATTYRGHTKLRVWHAGVLQADLALPPSTAIRYYDGSFALRALSDGSVLCCTPDRTGFRLLLVAGGRIVARGHLANLAGYNVVTPARDGRLLALNATGGSRCLEITRQGARLHLVPRAPTLHPGRSLALDDGIGLNEGGTFSFPDGRQVPAPSRVLVPDSGPHAPAGRYLLSTSRATPGQIRVFSPAHDDAWSFRLPGAILDERWWAVTPDGRYVLMVSTKDLPIPRTISHWLPFGGSRRWLMLYERPGRLCAVADIDALLRPRHGWIDAIPFLALAPDSHTVAFTYAYTRNNVSQLETVLLRW